MRQIFKWILDNVDCEDADVRAALSSIRMDDSPTGLRNDSEAAVAFLFPTDLVPNKRKDKRYVAEISATTEDGNKLVEATSQGNKIVHKVGIKVGT